MSRVGQSWGEKLIEGWREGVRQFNSISRHELLPTTLPSLKHTARLSLTSQVEVPHSDGFVIRT